MTKYLLALTASLVFAACGGDDHGHDHGTKTTKTADSHDGHDHGHSHDGEKFDLGSQAANGVTIKATQIGKAEAGHEIVLEAEVEGGKASDLRAWFGDATGTALPGAAKAKGNKGEDDFDVHVMAPKELPADAKLWVEADLGEGKTARASFAPKR